MEQENITHNFEHAAEYVKLMKMSKGYNWEIKVAGNKLDKLKELDAEMQQQWGTE